MMCPLMCSQCIAKRLERFIVAIYLFIMNVMKLQRSNQRVDNSLFYTQKSPLSLILLFFIYIRL